MKSKIRIVLALFLTATASVTASEWKVKEAVSASWTSAAPVNSVLATAVIGYSNVTVTLAATSTMTAGTLNFEASTDGGTSFPFAVACVRTNGSAAGETTFPLAVTSKAWQCSATGFTHFRVRLNPAITGTGTATVRVQATAAPIPPPVAAVRAGGEPFNCTVINSAATALTAFGGQCAAPGAGLSLYVTSITASASVASTTTADQYLTLKSGTGGTCGTGTAVVWASYSAANEAVTPNLPTPLAVAENSELCWQHAGTGSKTFSVSGYIGVSQ